MSSGERVILSAPRFSSRYYKSIYTGQHDALRGACCETHLDRPGAGDRNHVWTLREEPREGDLPWGGVVLDSDGVDACDNLDDLGEVFPGEPTRATASSARCFHLP